jgi:hypothetical protein
MYRFCSAIDVNPALMKLPFSMLNCTSHCSSCKLNAVRRWETIERYAFARSSTVAPFPKPNLSGFVYAPTANPLLRALSNSARVWSCRS